MRATLRSPIQFKGIGVHSGTAACVTVLPAQPGFGVAFRRIDLPARPLLPARWDLTGSLIQCTTLRHPSGAEVSTVEHLLAALAAHSIDDAEIQLDGPELPILDGSAAAFVAGVVRAGRAISTSRRYYIEILKPIEVDEGERSARLDPYAGMSITAEIDFADPLIGTSAIAVEITPSSFSRQLAPARTFCLERDVERLKSMGLAKGGSLENTVVVSNGRVMNPGGLRYPDEFVRHKALDVVGDLALAGAPILGRFMAKRPGHALNNALLRQLFKTESAWRWVTVPQSGANVAA